jgi:hypothetical protein
MTDQRSLDFVNTHVHSRAHSTEIIAAEMAAPKVSDRYRVILIFLDEYGPRTRDECNEHFDGRFMAQQRVSDLFGMGLIRKAERKGISRMNRPMNRWELTPEGREMIERGDE